MGWEVELRFMNVADQILESDDWEAEATATATVPYGRTELGMS